jgi:hypothetical protein
VAPLVLHPSLWHCRPLNSMIDLATNSIRCFDLLSWFSHRQLRMEQSWGEFRVVWSHVHSRPRTSCFSCVILRSNTNFRFNKLNFSLIVEFFFDSLMFLPRYPHDMIDVRSLSDRYFRHHSIERLRYENEKRGSLEWCSFSSAIAARSKTQHG